MHFRTLSVSLSSLLLFGFLAGCEKPKEEPPKEHVHPTGDELTWLVKETIPDTDHEIWLGHHGAHFHAGDVIEPAVAITSGGADVRDAAITNQLLASSDPATSFCIKSNLLFEPETTKEMAHYAQGAMMIPKDAKTCLIRFEVTLVGTTEPYVRDVELKLDH